MPQQRLLMRSGTPVRVGSRAMDILSVLLNRAGNVVTKDEIIRQVWPDTVVEENNLRVHLTALRKLLGEGHVNGRYIENIPGRGYSFVATVDQQNSRSDHTATASRPAAASNLPAILGEIIGRDAVIAALVAQLPQRRLVTLAGTGGVGKTTVALAVAEQLVGRYADGVFFIDLATIVDGSRVLSAFASTLGCVLDSSNSPDELIRFVGARNVLLLLDNCEQVVGGCATLVAAILKACRSVGILVTSREPLHVPGEWVQQLPPLALPPMSAASKLDEAIQYPAVRLFVDRAHAASSTFNPTDADTPIIVSICNRLDGLALAIELAASRVSSMGLRTLATSLDASLSSLSAGRRAAVPRHQALHALVDWSVKLLSATERSVLGRLGVFNGPFGMAAARSVCFSDDIASDEVEEALMNLIDKSLVTADIAGEHVRYRLLETTREYAHRMLDAAGERATVDRLHAQYHRTLFERAETEWQTRPTLDWREDYADQIGNLRSALTWSLSHAGEASTGIALSVAAIPLWFALSLVDECLTYVLRALALIEQTESQDARQRMKLYAALGWPQMSDLAGDRGGAAAWRKTLEIARTIADVDFQLRSLWALWVDRTNSAQPREALVLAREFRELTLRADEPADEWIGERMLGATFHFIGDQHSARSHLDRMLEFYVEPTNRSHAVRFQFDQRVTARVALARVLWLQGLTQRALDEIQETVEYALAINHKLSLANVLAEAACPVALLAGNMTLAERYIALLQEQTRAQALDVWNTYAECFRGEVLISRGAPAKGFAAIKAGLARLRRGGFLLFNSSYLAALARGYLATGHAAEGLASAAEALEGCEASGEGWCVPELLRLQGELHLLGDAADAAGQAEPEFRRSLEISRQQGALAWELRAAVSCAKLYTVQGRASEAQGLLQRAMNQFERGSTSQDLDAANLLLTRL